MERKDAERTEEKLRGETWDEEWRSGERDLFLSSEISPVLAPIK